MAVSGAVRARLFGPLVTYPNGARGTSRSNLVTFTTPWGTRASVHRIVADLFADCCRDADRKSAWKPQRTDSFNPRPIRGTSGADLDDISLHAYGLAIDFFATPPDLPPPGGVWTPDDPVPPEFARCFTDRGFRWGATFRRTDLPHIEWAEGFPPAVASPSEEDDMFTDADRAQLDRLHDRVKAIDESHSELSGPPSVRTVLSQILAGSGSVTAEQIAAAIPDGIAQDVADELARRLGG